MKEIPLANGKGIALVDDSDYELVSKHRWFRSSPRSGRNGRRYHYAQTKKGQRPNRTTVSMHRLIMGVEGYGTQVDHINGDGLDNRRENIRVCTISDNAAHSFHGRGRPNLYTHFKGVTRLDGKDGITRCWMARIGDGNNHRTAYLGTFRTAEEAAKAYDKAAKQLYGAFAKLNFPEE